MRRYLFCLPLLCTTTARADSGWDGVGILLGFGLLPLLALLAAFLISLFVSRAPWRHKLWSGIAIAAGLLAMLILTGSKAVELPVYAFVLYWMVPAAAWWASASWLRQRKRLT